MNSDKFRMPQAGSKVTAAGVRHVMLTYHYLDIGDIDGYASLTEQNVTLDHPGAPPYRGRDAVLSAHAAQATLLRRHELDTVVADEGRVVVLGRVVRQAPGTARGAAYDVDFADVFTLSGQTLVRECRRYYYAPPSNGLPTHPERPAAE
ncbi:nuclear transport factor 2 family protein [Streptomyces sp. NBC_01239]|uniref:nuclear transport factor 2 family protein n=1 Tax=Streptomyces sp. NBC_01239 TaxID=2903792 RepID=UPI002253FF2E|nr:nuclear transport factor 2 family protein [Streptomyces sp. NBC_01239]MCX4816904.1 nuclear transport factor 2 family protein [Streptomyces sp. NBC_01239]